MENECIVTGIYRSLVGVYFCSEKRKIMTYSWFSKGIMDGVAGRKIGKTGNKNKVYVQGGGGVLMGIKINVLGHLVLICIFSLFSCLQG